MMFRLCFKRQMNVQVSHAKIQEHVWINLLITNVHVSMVLQEKVVKLVIDPLNCDS